jgi:spore coat assembly protein
MDKIDIGSIVGRLSYGKDVIFKVCGFEENMDGSRTVLLKGVNERLKADALESDLEIINTKTKHKSKKV